MDGCVWLMDLTLKETKMPNCVCVCACVNLRAHMHVFVLVYVTWLYQMQTEQN